MSLGQRMNRFYFIAPDTVWLSGLVPLGVRLVQLRIKDAPLIDVRAQIKQAQAICAKYNAQLVVNDYWKLALDLDCDFVHLGQSDLLTADTGALAKARIRLGISSHDEDELERALSYDPDYVALGPVYPTLLKKMPWTPQGLDRLTAWKQRIGNIPLVAIGGLRVDRLDGVFKAGADSAVVITDILTADDPDAVTRDWIAATDG